MSQYSWETSRERLPRYPQSPSNWDTWFCPEQGSVRSQSTLREVQSTVYFITVPQYYIIPLTNNIILPLNIIPLHAQFCGSDSTVSIRI